VSLQQTGDRMKEAGVAAALAALVRQLHLPGENAARS
jgi:hypothetical protein